MARPTLDPVRRDRARKEGGRWSKRSGTSAAQARALGVSPRMVRHYNGGVAIPGDMAEHVERLARSRACDPWALPAGLHVRASYVRAECFTEAQLVRQLDPALDRETDTQAPADIAEMDFVRERCPGSLDALIERLEDHFAATSAALGLARALRERREDG